MGSVEPGVYTEQGRAEENWGGPGVGGRGEVGDGGEVEGEPQTRTLKSAVGSLLEDSEVGTFLGTPRLGTCPGGGRPWVLAMLREPPGASSWPCAPILRSPGASSRSDDFPWFPRASSREVRGRLSSLGCL